MVLHEAAKNEDFFLPEPALMPVTGWQDEGLPGPFLFSGDGEDVEDDVDDEENFDDMDDDFEDDDFEDDDYEDEDDDFEDEDGDFDYEEDADYDEFDE